jgi:hypothetical protein
MTFEKNEFEQTLKYQLKIVVSEFQLHQEKFVKYVRAFIPVFKKGMLHTVFPGTDEIALLQEEVIEECEMRIALADFMKRFESVKILCDFVLNSGTWHRKNATFEKVGNFEIRNAIPAAFLTRIFVLNNHRVYIDDASFGQAFEELVDYLYKDIVEFDLYIHLADVKGKLRSLELPGSSRITKFNQKMADAMTVRFGTSHFTSPYRITTDDYALVIKLTFPKSDFKWRKSREKFKFPRGQTADLSLGNNPHSFSKREYELRKLLR